MWRRHGSNALPRYADFLLRLIEDGLVNLPIMGRRELPKCLSKIINDPTESECGCDCLETVVKIITQGKLNKRKGLEASYEIKAWYVHQ